MKTDSKKSFPSVPKMQFRFGVRRKMLSRLKKYLNGQTQHLSVGDKKSEKICVKSGVSRSGCF